VRSRSGYTVHPQGGSISWFYVNTTGRSANGLGWLRSTCWCSSWVAFGVWVSFWCPVGALVGLLAGEPVGVEVGDSVGYR